MPTKSATIYSVARRAGVSIATVSRVQSGADRVSPDTRARVERAIEELGYRPNRLARGLAKRQHGATGIVFPDLSGPYYAEVILGYEEEVVSRGESLLILGTHDRSGSNELVLDLAGRVDGLLIMARTVSDDIVRGLEADGVPVVLLGRPPVRRTPAVRAANTESAIELVEHLLRAHGHRHVAFIGDPALSPDVSERWEGFVQAHRRSGMRPRDPERCAFREGEDFDVARAVLAARQRPTALVCANDEMAIGACGAAEELGLRVPADVAVTGWDDIPLARILPFPLTTVRQPMRELGARAAQLLFERIDGSGPARNVVLATEFVVRASCGCKGTDETTDEEEATG